MGMEGMEGMKHPPSVPWSAETSPRSRQPLDQTIFAATCRDRFLWKMLQKTISWPQRQSWLIQISWSSWREGWGASVVVDDGQSLIEAVIAVTLLLGGQRPPRAHVVFGEEEVVVMRGSYEYIGADGLTYVVDWEADENGFRAAAPHLPKGPSTYYVIT